MASTERRCSHCKRPTAGHGAKYGPSCTKEPLVLDPATQEYVEPPVVQVVTSVNSSDNVIPTEEYMTPRETVPSTFSYTVTTTAGSICDMDAMNAQADTEAGCEGTNQQVWSSGT